MAVHLLYQASARAVQPTHSYVGIRAREVEGTCFRGGIVISASAGCLTSCCANPNQRQHQVLWFARMASRDQQRARGNEVIITAWWHHGKGCFRNWWICSKCSAEAFAWAERVEVPKATWRIRIVECKRLLTGQFVLLPFLLGCTPFFQRICTHPRDWHHMYFINWCCLRTILHVARVKDCKLKIRLHLVQHGISDAPRLASRVTQRVEAGQHVSPQLHVLALEEVKRTCAADHPTRACWTTLQRLSRRLPGRKVQGGFLHLTWFCVVG
mmetsp:Transcript_25215/g.59993  ORF Transcript_25215/g.59993 Transcript_25215/m.59993 type:complete len:269 (+) Transcript_25215:2455-3261(+)